MAITLEEQVAKCEEALAAGGCVVTLVKSLLLWDYSNTPNPPASHPYTKSPVSDHDHTCAPQTASVQRITTVGGEKYYMIASFKYYYDPVVKAWRQALSLGGYFAATESQREQWEKYADAVGTLNPNDVFPKGCSDLPSTQPDSSPNPDPGKPDCPQLPLN